MTRNPGMESSLLLNVTSVKRKHSPSLGRPADTATVPQWIAWRAARDPNAVAVVEQGARATYRDLEHRSNRWARQLLSRGVEPEHLVGLYMERSIDYVAGALAILKAGGAYVPLDPSSPVEHLR